MMNKYITLALLLALVCSSFMPIAPAFCNRHGIRGHVYLVTGNQMPSPDAPRSKGQAMQTTLYVYQLTNISQVTRNGNSAFYSAIQTQLVKEISTDEKGYFKAKLNPGFYSLFVKKGELFYANIYDDKNNIYPIEVKKGNWTEVDFRADYGAVY